MAKVEAPVKCTTCGGRIFGPAVYYSGRAHCPECVQDSGVDCRFGPSQVLDWPLVRILVRLFRR